MAKSTICNSSCAVFDGSCGAAGVLIHLGRGMDEIRHEDILCIRYRSIRLVMHSREKPKVLFSCAMDLRDVIFVSNITMRKRNGI